MGAGVRVLAAYVIGLGGFVVSFYLAHYLGSILGFSRESTALLWFFMVVLLCVAPALACVGELGNQIMFLSAFCIWTILLVVTYGNWLPFLIILAIPAIPALLALAAGGAGRGGADGDGLQRLREIEIHHYDRGHMYAGRSFIYKDGDD